MTSPTASRFGTFGPFVAALTGADNLLQQLLRKVPLMFLLLLLAPPVLAAVLAAVTGRPGAG